jgi:oligopeptidase A
MNPLLDFSSFPVFDRFEPKLIAPAIDELLARAEAAVKLAEDPATPALWEAFVEPLESATEHLGRAWGMVGHLNAVADSPELREAYNANLPRMTQFWTALGQNPGLFAKYRQLADSPAGKTLDSVKQKIMSNTLRDFRLGGAELVAPASERFAEIQERQAQLSQKFSENVLDSTNAYELLIDDEAHLAGLPDDAKAAAKQSAQAKGKTGFLFSLQMPSYLPMMQYCENRTLRETLYRAYVTRASANAAAPIEADQRQALDNTELITEILKLRGDEAALLGYRNFAEVSLVSKMADTSEEVSAFLLDLAKRAKPFALRDLAELRQFSREQLGLVELAAWDTSFASERLKESRYAFSENEVKQYFPLPKVLKGLFDMVQRLFGVAISADQTSTWHPDVQFFALRRGEQVIGHFYLDLYARASKRPGAWMDDARSRKRSGTSVQTPIAYLTCNFQAPVGSRPALLTHDDVITLFHEFGHGLHHLLTRVDDLAVAGIAGVEWDAVELPSQFMENFCWDFATLSAMSAQIDSAQSLPRELFDKMSAAKNFQAGLQTLRQVEFALFDLRVHEMHIYDQAQLESPTANQADPQATDPKAIDLQATDLQAIIDEVRREVSVLTPPPYNRFQNSFSHIFAGGYAAGYYSYKWAEVLSADCFAAFEEHGLFSPEIGRKFLDEILSVGGSRPAIASFRAFRGRDPSIDALLRHNGMSQESAHSAALRG